MKLVAILSLLLSVSPAFSGEYPRTAGYIQCLEVDRGLNVVGQKKLVLTKNLISEDLAEWNLDEFIDGTLEQSTVLEKTEEGFDFSNGIASGKLGIETRSKDNFLNAKNMEPFYINYNYESSFFGTERNYKVKCLNLIF